MISTGRDLDGLIDGTVELTDHPSFIIEHTFGAIVNLLCCRLYYDGRYKVTISNVYLIESSTLMMYYQSSEKICVLPISREKD